jgi:hypothetical protein
MYLNKVLKVHYVTTGIYPDFTTLQYVTRHQRLKTGVITQTKKKKTAIKATKAASYLYPSY